MPVTDESSATEELVAADLDVEQGGPGELIRLHGPSADNSSLKWFSFYASSKLRNFSVYYSLNNLTTLTLRLMDSFFFPHRQFASL